MKFLKKIQKELTRTMKIKYSKSRFKCESNWVVRFMAIALTAIPRFPFTNFSIRYIWRQNRIIIKGRQEKFLEKTTLKDYPKKSFNSVSKFMIQRVPSIMTIILI